MKRNQRRIAGLLFCLSLLSSGLMAQENVVVQESLDWDKLRVRPGLSIYIPYVELAEMQITGNVYAEATYNLNTLADARGGIYLGSFNGISVGGTYHLSDKMVSKPTKFKVGSSTKGRTETTSFYKQNAEYRAVKGIAADLKAGKFGDSGFYMRIDGGLDWQTYGRSYFRGFASNKNGFTSMKLLATVAKFNQSEIQANTNDEYVSRVGAGALVSLFHERRPWKRITWHMGLDLGYMKIFGAKDLKTEYSTFEINKQNYILEMKGGLSIGI